MVNIRQAEVQDAGAMRDVDINTLYPEYEYKTYVYYVTHWPELNFVCEDVNTKKVVGYVLSGIDYRKEEGHVVSLMVLKSHRRRGLANSLMKLTHDQMQEYYEVKSCTLEVKVTNEPALALYKKLGYNKFKTLYCYYEDSEDAYNMRVYFQSNNKNNSLQGVQNSQVKSDKEKENEAQKLSKFHNKLHQNQQLIQNYEENTLDKMFIVQPTTLNSFQTPISEWEYEPQE